MKQRVNSTRRLSGGVFAASFVGGALLLAGCAETQLGAQAVKTAVRAQQASLSESPTVDPNEFEARGVTIWDGATTLQGVWFAHPLAKGVRRVRVRNIETGFEIEGALFRRDPALTGPSILVSSDAAKALGVLAGLPAELHIVALADPSLLRAAEAEAAAKAEAEAEAQTADVAAATEADGAAEAAPGEVSTEIATEEAQVAALETEPAPQPPSQPNDVAVAAQPAPATDARPPGETRRTSLLGPRAAAPAEPALPSDPVVQAAAQASRTPAPTTQNTPARPAAPAPQVAAVGANAPPPATTEAAPAPERRPDDVAKPPPDDPLAEELPSGSYVQAGSFRRAANAAALARRLRDRGQPARVVRVTLEGGRFSVVLMGPLPGQDAVDAAASAAAAEGITDAIKVNI